MAGAGRGGAYLLWVPLVDLYGGLREEILAPAYEDRLG